MGAAVSRGASGVTLQLALAPAGLRGALRACSASGSSAPGSTEPLRQLNLAPSPTPGTPLLLRSSSSNNAELEKTRRSRNGELRGGAAQAVLSRDYLAQAP